MQGRFRPPVVRRRAPVLDLIKTVQNRDEIGGEQAVRRASRTAVEDVDACRAIGSERGAQGLTFGGSGDEEGARALTPKPPPCGTCARTIGVGLQHRRARGGGGEVAQAPIVGGQRVKIDGQTRLGGVLIQGHMRAVTWRDDERDPGQATLHAS